MITIYSDSITERLLFVLAFIFEDRGVDYEVINDFKKYQAMEGPKVCYSDYPDAEGFQIYPSKLLLEESIDEQIEQKIDYVEWQGIQVFSFEGVPDLLASIFYFISDYTNQINKERDEHNRALGSLSLAAQYQLNDKLIAERWSEAFLDLLLKNGFEFTVQKLSFKWIPSFDIDNTFAYKLKDGLRSYLSRIKDLVKQDRRRKIEREYVLSGDKKDPYDTFDYIVGLKEYGVNPIVFYLLGDYGKYDRNIAWNDIRHQRHIRNLSREVEVYLHPSYKSNYEFSQLMEEKRRLETIILKEVERSRQHFLKLVVPYTYNQMMKAGFKHDYSTGYADLYGFRLGTARPVHFFDLKKNYQSELVLHSIAYMDGTLNQYLGFTIPEAKLVVQQLFEECKRYGGEFISLWHNETLGDYGIWKGWREVHDLMIELNKDA
ncbi:polysaccharide deacetylase family protein [Lishizhenia sp.]|uniref:polysaccharide deacetylase family protein n=1 Tax=Lishizhenia sp. TaxID=2497594 RepID=UPI00299E943A|nr:polysaccharide deacetylase family protein [Lishizhenia sp.]MDX1444850.1 polysaccharide deacetylase family protein [Lishizhenia sp.]